jgi:hypothetical protein
MNYACEGLERTRVSDPVQYASHDGRPSASNGFPDMAHANQPSHGNLFNQQLDTLYQEIIGGVIHGFDAESQDALDGTQALPKGDDFQGLISDRLSQLNSDGDSAVFQLRAEVKGAVAVGAKGQYGYRVEVTQSGGVLPDGANTVASAAEYQVSFDKRLLAGINGDLPFPVIDPKGELNLRSADGVTLTFDTREEAAQAVVSLARVAASETLQDTGSLASPATAASLDKIGVPRNPLMEEVGNSRTSISGESPSGSPAETIFEIGAASVAPDADETAFLTDHITAYTTHLDAQARIALGADLPLGILKLGGELRLDKVSGITRTVELPRDGRPGRVTYTFSLADKLRSKEGGAVGVEIPDVLKAGAGLNTRLDHAAWTRAVSMSWEFGENEMGGPAISGHTYPEISAAFQGDLGLPDAISVRLDAGGQDQPIWDLSRTNFVDTSVELTIEQPGKAGAAAVQAALNGDLNGAMTAVGENAQLTLTNQHTDRSGFDLQPEVSLDVVDVGKVKAGLIMETGVDDVTRRNEVVVGSQPAALAPAETPLVGSNQAVANPQSAAPASAAPFGSAPRPDTDEILTRYQVQDSQAPLIKAYHPRFVREMQKTSLLGISPWDAVQSAGNLWGALADTLGLKDTDVAGIPMGRLDAKTLNQLFTIERIPVEEAALLDQMGPQELFEMRDLRNMAFDEANRHYPWEGQVDPGYGKNDGHNDAFRHTYWNALMTAHFGEDFATAYATAHEAAPGNPGAREAMDLFNNELGRRIAKAHPDASDAELAEYVRQAVTHGESLVLDAEGNLAWSDTVALHRHGLAENLGLPPLEGVINPDRIVAPDTTSH